MQVAQKNYIFLYFFVFSQGFSRDNHLFYLQSFLSVLELVNSFPASIWEGEFGAKPHSEYSRSCRGHSLVLPRNGEKEGKKKGKSLYVLYVKFDEILLSIVYYVIS